MALSVTSLTNGSLAPGSSISGYTTASISPTANSLLILSSGAYDGAGTQNFTIASVSGLGLTWTAQKVTGAGTADKGDVELWTAPAGGSPGSGTITVTLTAGSSGNGGQAWGVDQVTGQDPVTPIVTSNTQAANNSSAAAAVTFAAAGSSNNLFYMMSVALLGSGQSNTQTPAETPAWSALDNVQSNTTSSNGVQLLTQISPDVTNTAGSSTLSASHSWGAIGIEIAAAAAGAATATPQPYVVPSLAAIQAACW